jgi:hypothetical protein
MKSTQLTRHSNNRLYLGTIEVKIEEHYGASLICINPYSAKSLERAISDKAKILGANAHEFCGAKLLDWSGEYCGSYSFYKIDSTILEKERNGQFEFSFA